MEVIEKIFRFIDNLDSRQFYIYLASSLAILLLLASGIIWRYYSSIHAIQDRIETINEQRERAKRLLSQYENIKKHRTEVDALLAKNPDFKIGGYFGSVLATLGLTDKKTTADEYSRIDHNKYTEIIFKAKLTDMNMKQLCELLYTLDSNKRIYTKELEITKSKQTRKAIDVTLTIATLEPKSVIT